MPKKLNFAALASTLAHHLKINPGEFDGLRIVTKGLEDDAFKESVQFNLQHFIDLSIMPWFDYSLVIKGDLNSPLLVMISWLKEFSTSDMYAYLDENEDFFVESALRKSFLAKNIGYFSGLFDGPDLIVQGAADRLFFADHGKETLKYYSQDKKAPKSGMFSYLGVAFDELDSDKMVSGKCYEFKIQRDRVLSLSFADQIVGNIAENSQFKDLSSYQVWIDSSLDLGLWVLVDRCLKFGAKTDGLILPSALFSYDPSITFFQFLSSEHQPKIYLDINWDIGRAQILVID
jgi:hypothetical protein